MTDEIPETWSWSKFFGGFFNGLNTAKAITTMFHQVIVVTIVVSVGFMGMKVWRYFHKAKVAQGPVCVTTNNGTIHSSSDEIKKQYGLFNV